MSTSTILDEYFDEAGLAAYLGKKCTRTLARWRQQKKGPPVTVLMGRLFYRKAAVAEWLRSLEQGSAAA